MLDTLKGIKGCEKAVEAIAMNKKNGTTYWQDAIAKEVKNVKIAFQILIMVRRP